MNISPSAQRRRSDAMTLLALETMPCGCVAGVYQARPTVVEVEFVEAKGPHCVFSGHRTGKVTRLGVPAVNFGPGDPMFAHKQDEHVPTEHIERCERILKEWLS